MIASFESRYPQPSATGPGLRRHHSIPSDIDSVSSSRTVSAAFFRKPDAASDDTLAIADSAGMLGTSASVNRRVPRKFTVTTLTGSPIPDDTPATLKSASTG